MFKISFDFDETTKRISNVRVVSQDLSKPTVEVLDNKLQLSQSAIALLNAKPNDRISINYWNVNNETTFPLIGLSSSFGEDNGNRLTNSNTVSFRGRQRETLLIYGNLFTLEQFESKGGLFSLVPVTEEKDSEEVEFTTSLDEDLPIFN